MLEARLARGQHRPAPLGIDLDIDLGGTGR